VRIDSLCSCTLPPWPFWLKYASVRAPEFSKQSLAFLHGSEALVGRTTVVT
jgi:hypothetical protein